MGEKQSSPKAVELREFIKDSYQSLFDFCYYTTCGFEGVEELVLAIFRRFGDHYRKLTRKNSPFNEPLSLRFELYRMAWEEIQRAVSKGIVPWQMGTSQPREHWSEKNLLSSPNWVLGKNPELDPIFLQRLAVLPLELRVPVVLRDIVHFEDDEIVRVLGVRWVVYRHRLNRGRLEFKDSLQGGGA